MRKKSFLWLMLSLFALTAWAELPATGDTGYLYNAATGKFFSSGVTTVSNSGALVDDYGIPVEIKNEGAATEFADHTYLRLQLCDYYGRYLRIVTGGLDCTGSSYHKWAAQEVTGGFVLRCIYKDTQVAYATQGNYVSIAADGSLVLAEGLENAAVWQWTSAADQKVIVAANEKARIESLATQAGLTGVTTLAELETALAEWTATDATSAVTNPTLFENLDGWTVNNIQGTAINNGSYRIQNAAGTQATCSQTVTGLEPGIYRVQVQAFYRASVLARTKTMGDAGYYFTNAYIQANDQKVQVKDWYSIATDDYTRPASRSHIADVFDEGEQYTNTVYAYVGEEGELTLTIAVPSFSAGDYPNWICFNNVRLTRYEAPAEPEPETPLEEGIYYLYNVGAGLWLNYGGDDDYTAVLKPHGEPLRLFVYEGTCGFGTSLDSRYLNASSTTENARSTGATYFTYTKQADGSYTLRSEEGLMGFAGTVGDRLSQTKVAMNLSDADDVNTHWQLLTKEQLLARFSEATADNPVDATFLITCPNFDRHHTGLSAWSGYSTGNNVGYLCNNSCWVFNVTNACWQKLTDVPNGIYKLRAQAFYRHGSNTEVMAQTEETMTKQGVIYANDQESFVLPILSTANLQATNIYSANGGNGRAFGSSGYIPYFENGGSKASTDACIAFDHGLFGGNEVQVTVTDGQLTIGAKIKQLTTNSWMAFDNFELYYLGMPEDLSEYETLLAKAVNEANELVLPTKAKETLDAVITEYNKEYTSSADYLAAIEAINAAKAEAQPIADAFADYNGLKQMIQDKLLTQTDAYTDEGGAATEHLTSELATLDNSALVDQADEANDLELAQKDAWAFALTWMTSVSIDTEKGLDLTWMIQDADFSSASYKNYWEESGVSGGTVGVTHGVMRYMNTSFDLRQTLPYRLPAGAYKLTADGFERTHSPLSTAYSNFTAGTSVVKGYIFFNSDEQLVWNLLDMQDVKDNSLGGVDSGGGFYVPDGSSAANTYLAAGHYPNTLSAVLTEHADVTIGYRSDNTNEWTCIDNFKLRYYGPLDLSEYEAQLALAVDEANNLVLPTKQKGILDDVVTENNKTYTSEADYQAAIANINAAKAVAQPFVEPYAQYKQMKQMIQERFIGQTEVYTDETDAATTYTNNIAGKDSEVEQAEAVADIEAATAALWTEALSFVKAVKINEGQGFDLTWMIQDADFSDSSYKNFWTETCASTNAHGVVGGNNILRYYACDFDVRQTLPYVMPAGAYKMTVDGFERTNSPINDAYTQYAAGNSTVTAVVYMNDNEQTLMNLFDVQSVTDNSLGGVQPSGASFYVADGSSAASKYIDAGHYPNTLIAVLADDAEATIGYRCANSNAWTAVDNFRLWYIGEVPSIEIATKANELNPICAPITLSTDDEQIDALYLVGSVGEGTALLYPVSTVAPGTPCVALVNTSTLRAPMEVTSSKTYVLPWDGGTLQPDDANYTWTYVDLADASHAADELTLQVLDPMAMDFAVNIENLAARKFLSNVTYVGASEPSVVAKYNVAPPTRRDIPNAVMIPMPLGLTTGATVSLDDGTTVDVAAGDAAAYIYNLLPAQTYSYSITAEGTTVGQGQFTTTGTLRMVYAPSAYNIRDLGGWRAQDGKRTNYGHLFRGSTLNGYATATAEDLQTLRDLGVGGEIDLRYREDYDKDMGCGTSAFGFGTADYYFAAANDWTAANISEAGTQQRLKQEFDFILDHFRQDKAVYYHCAWGADRTGLLTLMLEGILGVELDQIYKDYELTSFSAAPGATNRLKTSFQDRIDVIQALEGETLRDKFENYFTNKLGVSADDIAYFRSVMLSDDEEPAVEPVAYEFVASEWPAGDPARISAENVTVDTEANTITVSNTEGDNNVALRFQTTNRYYVTPEQRYFTIRATGLHTGEGKSYLWWLNNANHYSQVPPTTIYLDGDVTVFAWDIRTCGLGDNFSTTENTELQTIGDWVTTFGMTMAAGTTPVVISYIGFEESVPEPVEEYEYSFLASEWPAGDPGRISASNVSVDDEANTITIANTAGPNNVALNFMSERILYVEEGIRYFVIQGTGLSTDEGSAKLWWLNAKNNGGEMPPTLVRTDDDGTVTLLWDIQTDATFASGFNATGRTYLDTTGAATWGWTTTFGLTMADEAEPVVITNIGYLKADDELVTGIEETFNAQSTKHGEVYDLSGRRIRTLTKGGLYIIDGKKVLVK